MANPQNIQVKETRHKRLHIVQLHSHETSAEGKSIETENRLVTT